MEQSRLLTEGSVSRALLRFALPILGTSALQYLNGAVNTIWVGRYLGEAALTAVVNANVVILLLMGTVLGIGGAATILIGQSVGADNLSYARKVTGTSAGFFALVSLAISAAGLTFSEPLLTLMAVPAESIPLAVGYLRVMFSTLPVIYMYVLITSIVRGVGDSKTPLYFMLLSVVIDVLLTPVFIFGLGPIPAMGLVGSAVALLVAHLAGLAGIIVYVYRRKHPLCLHWRDYSLLRIDLSILGTLVQKGVPMSLEILVGSLSSVLLFTLVNRFGVDIAAAYSASLQFWMYIQLPAIAISMAVTTMSALSMGRNEWDRVRWIARTGVLWSVCLTGAMIVIILALDQNLYQLFLPKGSQTVQIVSHINHVVAWSFVPSAVAVVLVGVMRAIGVVVAPLLVNAFTLIVLRFSFALVLLDSLRVEAIWWTFPVSSIATLLLVSLYYRYGAWRLRPLLVPVPQDSLASPSIASP